MSDIIIKVENVSKLYRLGTIGTGYLRQDVNRWWQQSVLKKKDVFYGPDVHSDSESPDYLWALKNVSFNINEGDVCGIIGRNGSGKSTLLKILSRITRPTEGRVRGRGKVNSLLEVGTGFHPELTGRENIYLSGHMLGMKRWEIKKKYDEIVEFSGVERFLDTPVKRYSSGMYVRLAFAVAAHMEPDILIVDEVLAVGDSEFQKKCMGKIKNVSVNEGRTILFVSHQMSTIQSLCNKCVYLKKGMLISEGPTKETIDHYTKDNRRVKNFKKFDKYLKYARIEQNGSYLKIEAEYDCDFGLDIPHLGFVIHNSDGIPVFASNPTLDLHNVNIKRTYRKGSIIIEINQPKLIDGEYVASIWFGDSKENFISEQECITFEVLGMTDKKQYTQSLTGNVIPELSWKFNEYE